MGRQQPENAEGTHEGGEVVRIERIELDENQNGRNAEGRAIDGVT